MPRKTLFSPIERASLLSLPETEAERNRHYTFTETDLSLIRQRRGDANRLGFAVQLCLLRYPGQGLQIGETVEDGLLEWIARSLKVKTTCWPQYSSREATRLDHLLELRTYLGLRPFGVSELREMRVFLGALALQTDKAITLALKALEECRRQKVQVPSLNLVERLCAEAITTANRQICATLVESLSVAQRAKLDELLTLKPHTHLTWLAWLRQSPVKPNSRHMLEHIERLKEFQSLQLPDGLERRVHQNRLLKMAREGGQMTPRDLGKFESQRKYATLVALALEGTATVIDQIIDLHDRIIGKLFNAAKHKHQHRFKNSGKDINDQIRLYGQVGAALLKAKEDQADAFEAIESVMTWEDFTVSVKEAQQLAQPAEFDYLHLLGENYPTIRRYAPAMLEVLQWRASPAGQAVLDAIEQIRTLNNQSLRNLTEDAPIQFIKKRWGKLVKTAQGLNRRYYELCALCELKNGLRSGDLWVQGSRQFKDFEEYLIPAPAYAELKQAGRIPLAVTLHSESYLKERIDLLEEQLETVNRLALSNDLGVASENGKYSTLRQGWWP